MSMMPRRVLEAALPVGVAAALAALPAAPIGGETAHAEEREAALPAASEEGMAMDAPDRESAVLPAADITITEIFNNILFDEGMASSWGFSCVVRLTGRTILFDTGGDGEILLGNMAAAGIEPSSIDIVFLSHEHWDHIGGLRDFLERNGGAAVYAPASFGGEYREILSGLGIEPVDVTGPVEICPGVWSTGVLDRGIPEQSLVVSTDRGPVVMTGCAHPGIVDIAARARSIARRDPLLVMGGFHLGKADRAELERVVSSLKELGARHVSPSHCTGGDAIEALRKGFGKRFVEGGAGRIHEIGKLE